MAVLGVGGMVADIEFDAFADLEFAASTESELGWLGVDSS
jgi:hypothetical protein